MAKVKVCDSLIDELGNCMSEMVWVELADVTPLTFSEFTQVLPYLVGVLFTVWGIKQLTRQIFNR